MDKIIKVIMMNFELNDPHFLPHVGCNLQLSVNSGEMLVLVGENGLGKSTLLRRFSDSVNPRHRVVVPQKQLDFFYDRKLSTLKSLFMNSLPEGLHLEDFNYLWNSFGLKEKEDRLISHLSGGEAQCLKLCLTLPRDVNIYFLDEPSQYLDVVRKKLLLGYLKKLSGNNKSILIVEHNKDWIEGSVRAQELIIEQRFLQLGRSWNI